MKIAFSILLLGGALALAETNQLYVATITGVGRNRTNTFVLSNVVSVARCQDRTNSTCTNLVYLRNGKTNRFHTQLRFEFELRPQ